MSDTKKIFQDSILWFRLACCVNTHIKKALRNVVHNDIKHLQVTGIPSDPKDLYRFLQLQTNQDNVRKAKHIKKEQKAILLPTSYQSVDSSLLDISLIRWLIQTFCNIRNARGNWEEPDPTDKTICAFVHRAANMRNKIFHYKDVATLDENTFEAMWMEIKSILTGLMYTEDIDAMRTETVDITKIQGEMLKEFRDHLEEYKIEISKENSPELYIQRRFSVDNDQNYIATEIHKLIHENDQVNIFANAGVGKSVTARHIKYEWSKERILDDFYLLYFDSKKMYPNIRYNSFSAPLFFSELEHHLREKGKTERNFEYFDCVQTKIDNLFIIVDGVDELSIKGLTDEYVNDLKKKVIDNKEISAKDTIIAIYFQFLFPCSKICLFGRNGEFEELKRLKLSHHRTIFSEKKRRIKDLELLKFDDANIQEFTCLKICKQEETNGQRNCTSDCKDIYEKFKDIEHCKTPTDLNSLIELHKKHPIKDIGKITRTKLTIATLFNRFTNHIKQRNITPIKSFRELSEKNEFSKYLECVRILGEISFKSLLEYNIAVQVEEKQGHFIYKKEINVERKPLEELDFFYVRDFVYYFILEPHYTLDIEFLSACYLFSHPDEWNSILNLSRDNKLVIILFIAGLHADDYFTKDFAKNVLSTSSYSLEQFLSWLYNVEDVRESLPDGGYFKNSSCWFGLMENQKLSPSFFLLDYISHEVEIPQRFIPNTIVCFCYGSSSFEWFDMNFFKHKVITHISDKLNIESFLKKFPSFKFIIKENKWIEENDKINRLDQFGANNQITFKINELTINKPVDICFSSNFNVNTLEIGYECDSRTIGMMLNALSPPPTNTSSSTLKPTLKCKLLPIWNNIAYFNSQQTEKLFELCLSGVVDTIILNSSFFTDGQFAILENVERNSQNLINIVLKSIKFNNMLDLPLLGNRNICLHCVKDVTEKDVIKFRGHIPLVSQGYRNNFSNYKILGPVEPFVRKENSSRDVEQSMYINFCSVDFKNVSPEVFAKTFSIIPSLSCNDDNNIPPSHWLTLSQIDNCQINELRIWEPRKKNFDHFLNIKTKMVQFTFPDDFNGKDELKQLLDHIVNNQNIALEKQIKVFVVNFDSNDWDYYQEIMVFSGKTIREYKNNYNSYNLKLDDICVPFHQGERLSKHWCCEILQLTQKNINLAIVFPTEIKV